MALPLNHKYRSLTGGLLNNVGGNKGGQMTGQPLLPNSKDKFWTGEKFLTNPSEIEAWKAENEGNYDPLAMEAPSDGGTLNQGAMEQPMTTNIPVEMPEENVEMGKYFKDIPLEDEEKIKSFLKSTYPDETPKQRFERAKQIVEIRKNKLDIEKQKTESKQSFAEQRGATQLEGSEQAILTPKEKVDEAMPDSIVKDQPMQALGEKTAESAVERWGKISEAYTRGGGMRAILSPDVMGTTTPAGTEQKVGETRAQILGNVVGFFTDALFNTAVEGFKAGPQNQPLIKGVDALKNVILDTESGEATVKAIGDAAVYGMDEWNKFKEAHPVWAADMEAAVNIADLLPAMNAKKIGQFFTKMGRDAAEEATKKIIKKAGKESLESGKSVLLGRTEEMIRLQDDAIEGLELSVKDVKGAKNIDEMGEGVTKSKKKNIEDIDIETGKDTTKYGVEDTKTISGGKEYNDVEDAIIALDEIATKNRDKKLTPKIEKYKTKFYKDGDGLTRTEINDIARELGYNKKTFNKYGQELTSTQAKQSESIRKSLKEWIRYGGDTTNIDGTKLQKLDYNISRQIKTEEYISKLKNKLDLEIQNIKDTGKIAKFIGFLGNVATLGQKNAIMGYIGKGLKIPGAGKMTMRQFEKALKKNLKKYIKTVAKKTKVTPEKVIKPKILKTPKKPKEVVPEVVKPPKSEILEPKAPPKVKGLVEKTQPTKQNFKITEPVTPANTAKLKPKAKPIVKKETPKGLPYVEPEYKKNMSEIDFMNIQKGDVTELGKVTGVSYPGGIKKLTIEGSKKPIGMDKINKGYRKKGADFDKMVTKEAGMKPQKQVTLFKSNDAEVAKKYVLEELGLKEVPDDINDLQKIATIINKNTGDAKRTQLMKELKDKYKPRTKPKAKVLPKKEKKPTPKLPNKEKKPIKLPPDDKPTTSVLKPKEVKVEKKALKPLNEKTTQLVSKVEVKDDLVKEAKKYGSAEEFIDGLDKKGSLVYHGTNKKFDKFSKEYIGENRRTDWGNGISFTDSKKVAKSFAKDANGDIIMKSDISHLKFADGNKLSDDPKLSSILDDDMGFEDVYDDYLKPKGYDGLKFKHNDGSIEYVVYNVEDIKTESQLTKIRNEANKGLKPKTLDVKAKQLVSKVEVKDKGLKKKKTKVLDQKTGGEVAMLDTTKERLDNFKKWFKESKVVDNDGNPLEVYHGSTHDFDVFNKEVGNIEGHHGKGLYFTDDLSDVEINYAGQGPDLTNKIERLAEQIENNQDIPYDDAKKIATKQLKGSKEKIYETNLKMEKPVIISDDGTFLDFDMEYEEGKLMDVMEAIRNNLYNYDTYDVDGAMSSIWENLSDEIYDGGINAKDFEKAYRSAEGLFDVGDDAGDLAMNEILRQSYEDAGFDGIILKNAENEFKTMGLNGDTTHYVVFDPKQIKSVKNQGSFNPNDANIYKAMIPPAFVAIGLGYLMTQ